MARPDTWVSFGPLRGQNSTENPLALPPGTAISTNNIVLDPESCVAVKRKGSTELSGVPSGDVYLVARHKPAGATEANAELWLFYFDGANFQASRKVGSAAFSAVTWPTGVTALRTVTLNGKLFIAGLTNATNRLYVWDGTQVRPSGQAPSAAPTVADTGAGTYPPVLRYYKVDWIYVASGAIISARSELSPSVSFTPSGTGTAARVTKPTTPGVATHWRVWGSADDVTYFMLSGNMGVATTTFDDSVAPSAYSGEQPGEVGTYLTPPSATRIITDGNRLLMAGSGTSATTAGTGETLPKSNRVWYTPVLGSSDQGDDERIPDNGTQVNYLDLGENTNDGEITELVGPVDGVVFAFTKRRIWKLVPTGDLVTPYVTYPVSDRYGAIGGVVAGDAAKSLATAAIPGEDEAGAPSAYFLADSGLYRVGKAGVQFVSFEIQTDYTAQNNTNPWLFSYPQKKQIWLVTKNANGNAVFFVFHWGQGRPDNDGDVREGWTTWTYGDVVEFSSGAVHNTTPGTVSTVAEALIPYLSARTNGARVFERAAATDGATNYAASVTYAPILPTLGQALVRLGNPTVIATAASGVSLRLSADRDFGTETRTADVSLTAVGSETRVVRKVEGLFSADDTAISLSIGDASANANLWRVDWLTAPIAKQESR